MFDEIKEYLMPESKQYPNLPKAVRIYFFGSSLVGFVGLWTANAMVFSISLSWYMDPETFSNANIVSEIYRIQSQPFYSELFGWVSGFVVACLIFIGSWGVRNTSRLTQMIAVTAAPLFYLYISIVRWDLICPESSLFYRVCIANFEVPFFGFSASGQVALSLIFIAFLVGFNTVIAVISFGQLSRSVKLVLRDEDIRTSSVEDLLTKEESLTHEYKSSFQTPLDHPLPTEIEDGKTLLIMGRLRFQSLNEVKTFLQTQCLKTIVGFLNSKGGTLVVGIHESGRENNYLGIEREIGFQDPDQFERHFVQQIINRIGARFASNFIETKFVTRDGKLFFIVFVDKYLPGRSEIPAMLDGKDVYRRTGPRTDRVPDGEQLLRFVTERQVGK